MKNYKIELITNYMKENNLSKTAFCKQCKISYGVLNKILKDKSNIRLNVFFKIAKVLNIKVYELWY